MRDDEITAVRTAGRQTRRAFAVLLAGGLGAVVGAALLLAALLVTDARFRGAFGSGAGLFLVPVCLATGGVLGMVVGVGVVATRLTRP